MKLETFDATNTKAERVTAPIIHITKSGLFSFSNGIVQKIGLKEYQVIKFHHDKDNPGDWYMEIVEEGGFVLRRKDKKKDVKTLAFGNAPLANLIFESVAFKGEGGRVVLGEPVEFEGRTLYTLVTASLRSSQN